MARVRGTDFFDARGFVRDAHGAAAHERVLDALPSEAQGLWRGPLRQASWYPIEALRLYLRTARGLLEPDAPDFYLRQGRDAARRQKGGALASMVATPALRMRLAPLVWRLFYDVGHLEVLGRDPATVVCRIHGFPASPEMCERFRGIWEGMASTPTGERRVEEPRCVLRGDPFCELIFVT